MSGFDSKINSCTLSVSYDYYELTTLNTFPISLVQFVVLFVCLFSDNESDNHLSSVWYPEMYAAYVCMLLLDN